MTAAAPGHAERFALGELLHQAAGEIRRCRSAAVVCRSCEAQINAVLDAADTYAIAAPAATAAGGDDPAAVELLLEQAQHAAAFERDRADTAEAELSALADRLGAAIRAAAQGERKRIRDLAVLSGAECREGDGTPHPFASLIGESSGA